MLTDTQTIFKNNIVYQSQIMFDPSFMQVYILRQKHKVSEEREHEGKNML